MAWNAKSRKELRNDDVCRFSLRFVKDLGSIVVSTDLWPYKFRISAAVEFRAVRVVFTWRIQMDEFIQLVTKQLGLSAADGKSATGSILKMIQEQLDPATFSQITSKLPGIQGLISDSQQAVGSGGLMGSLTSLAGSFMGEKAKGVAEITAALTKSGVSLDKIPQYLTMLIEFLKNKLGNDLFASVAAKLPELLGKGG